MQLTKAATLPSLGNDDDHLQLWQALLDLMNDERGVIRWRSSGMANVP